MDQRSDDPPQPAGHQGSSESRSLCIFDSHCHFPSIETLQQSVQGKLGANRCCREDEVEGQANPTQGSSPSMISVPEQPLSIQMETLREYFSSISTGKVNSSDGRDLGEATDLDTAVGEELLRTLPQQLCICSTAYSTDWRSLEFLAGIRQQANRGPFLGQEGESPTSVTNSDELKGKLSTPIWSVPQHFRVGFGVHPWWAPEWSSGIVGNSEPPTTAPVESLLRNLLGRFPDAIVGEIGLDKHTGDAHWDAQVAVFKTQLTIAAEFRRPVSVHCVRAFGPMLDILRSHQPLPPSIVLHGFTGSTDFVNSLLKIPKKRGLNVYFGIGLATTAKLKSFEELVKAIPSDRVLIESDAYTAQERSEKLFGIVKLLAKTWQMTESMVLQLTKANGENALRCP